MTSLVKPLLYEVIPATPGTAGTPYVPAQPERTVVQYVETCNYTGCFTSEVYVTIPATDAIPAVPSTAPTAEVVNTYYDRAWNSAADSIGSVPPGSYIEAKVKYGSYAAFIGLDSNTVYSTSPASYRYGIMVDASGVRVFENGVAGALLAGANTTTTTLRIVRSETGQVYYHVLGNSLVASPQAPIPSTITAQGYGLLYSSLDQIDDARIATLDMVEGVVAFYVATDFVVKTDQRVLFDVMTDFLVSPSTTVIFPISADFSATPSSVSLGDVTFPITVSFEPSGSGGGSGTWALPAVIMHGSDYDDPGFGTWRLPRMAMTGTEQTYVPATPTEGFWILPRVAAWGLGYDEDHGSGDWTLRAVDMLGTEEGVTYGQGDWQLPIHFSMQSSPPWWPQDTLVLVSGMSSTQTLTLQQDLLLILNSYGELTSTLTLSREYLLSLLSGMVAQSSFSMVGVYPLSLLSSLVAGSFQALQLQTGADLPSDAAVWVVNLDTSASAQYEDYGFNSFFRRGDDYFGVANDGIYQLTGATDAGQPIQALAALVRSTLGAQTVKHVPSVYLGAASDGALILRVDSDGVVRYYRARTSSTALQQHRVDIGRGVRGTYWEFELLNQNGEDFEIADVTLLPVALDRRI